MTATVLQNFQILTTADPLAAQPSSVPAIVFMGLVHDEQEAASEARWNTLFIGSLDEFHQRFTSRMAREFDQGKYLGRQHRLVRSSDFIRHLNKAIEQARPLSASVLRQHGMSAVTWSRNDAESLGITDLPIIAKVAFFTDTRYGFEILEDADAQRLVLYAMTLKQIAKRAGNYDTLFTGRPMREHPTRLKSDLAY